MYKQCFELLTAQGPKPQKSFSVNSGAPEVAKDLDGEIKGNIFYLQNQRIQLPPNPAQLTADFHNTGASTSTKRVGVVQSLNIVHQFLIFQIYVAQGDPLQIELTVRDKHNTRRRLMFCDGTKAIQVNQMHARIPNVMVERDRWLNLCIDVNSFIRELFTRTNGAYGTPQMPASQQPMANGQRANVGGGSGDIAALHSGKHNEISGQSYASKVATVLAKQAQQQTANNQNSLKTIEIIQLEGTFKIRKIFTSRSQIPAELTDNPFGGANAGATVMSGKTMRAEDIIQAAMVGQRIEQIPKNFDFGAQVERINQVVSYRAVAGLEEQLRISDVSPAIDDSMLVTGMRMTGNAPQMQIQPGSQPSISYDGNPNETYSNIQENDGEGPVLSYVSHHNGPNNFLGIRSGSSALKNKQAFRAASNDRKSSCGGDSASNHNGSSPKNRGPMGPGGNPFFIQKAQVDNFRLGNNSSKQTVSSVIVVDQEQQEQDQFQNLQQQMVVGSSGLRNSGIGMKQPGKQMKISSNMNSNTTGDTIFKQANSTTSNNCQRSNQTQSTAFSVRTTSSGRQKKGKLANGGGPGSNLQTSQSPFTDNNSGTGGGFTRKRSVHASSGRPVYEQVDEMEESGSGQISQKLQDQHREQASREAQRNLTNDSNRVISPPHAAKSAKVKRKGVPKTNIDTNLPHSSEKMQLLAKQIDPVTTPKLLQLQEVHQTTILEENETLRGSIDRYPGSKLGLHGMSHSGAKKFNKVSQIEKKGVNNLSAAGARKGQASSVQNKAVRTKSSVASNGAGSTIQEQVSAIPGQIHPLVKGKAINAKVSVSSSNLEESLNGIVGSKIQSRQAGSRKQVSNPNVGGNLNKAISPNLHRKAQLPKNQLQASGQKRIGQQQPQFEVRNGKTQSQAIGQHGASRGNQGNQQTAQFIYNGTGYGSNQMNNLMDSDGEQSDFKTTTLRFTNNNFINNNEQRRERDSSTGAIQNNRESSFHNQYNNGQANAGNSLLNTLSSQNNAVSQIAQQNRRNSKQFGTSDNFKGLGQPSFQNQNQNFDQRTDGFSRLRNGGDTQSKSPTHRQFSTMHGKLNSAGAPPDLEDEEEEQIEEDICDQGESPLINAQTKQNNGQKAKQLFLAQQPPLFRSTESDNFNSDAMMTGFGQTKTGAAEGTGFKDRTPFHDKSSILASKPYLGGKPRQQLLKSPDRSFHNYGNDFNSAGGGLVSEMRQVNQNELQKEIEEEIGEGDRKFERDANNYMEDSYEKRAGEVDPTDTQTSDFYQVPIQGGIPVQLTIENGRRPFTPPFAQLIRVGKPPQSGSSISRGVAPSQQSTSHKKPPQWVSPAGPPQHISQGVMSSQDKLDLERRILEGEEEPIEEEIEGVEHSTISPAVSKQKPASSKAATTKDSSSEVEGKASSRNNTKDVTCTFAEEPIEFSESFKRKEGLHPNIAEASMRNRRSQDLVDPAGSGSNCQTFGRRSRMDQQNTNTGTVEQSNDDYADDYDEDDELDRQQSFKQSSAKQKEPIQICEGGVKEALTASLYQKDVMDPKVIDQKKRLLYDKSLKAYYDPETGQYFEMKAQLIPQSSLGQLEEQIP